MEQYISKSALVVEMENLENTYKKCPTRNSYEEGLKEGRLIGYKDALHKINTLEVKEFQKKKLYVVTRCEEHSDYVEEAFFSEKKAEEYCKQFEGNEDAYGRDITEIEADFPLEVKEVDYDKEVTEYLNNFKNANIGHRLSLRRCAKHFFELGLKAQKGE